MPHLLALRARTGVLVGIEELALVDVDSLLRPVYASKQGASFGHTKIANRQVLRKGLSPLVTTISIGRSADGTGNRESQRRTAERV